ncbi:hypothetical protein KSB_93960 [Ktedonobacter robiniae]|uniref:Uncharacterized protein n=1 Tax=Ktedonobacter robiniae TaxID=2778365 RepID=A0ABQ3V6Q9_9CHLR|nr:hypothetical protein KSB_93960 [Ktedonobacter robiniae]
MILLWLLMLAHLNAKTYMTFVVTNDSNYSLKEVWLFLATIPLWLIVEVPSIKEEEKVGTNAGT